MEQFYAEHYDLFGEKWAIKMIKTQACKALHDFKKGDDYCKHLALVAQLIQDYAQVKGINLNQYLTK